MRDAGAVPLHWHAARWWRAQPGPRGLAWLAVLTLLLVIPLERFGADIPWSTQARVLINLGVTVAAIVFGRDTALSDEAERWLLLQGYSPADWAWARWCANLLPLATLAIGWALLVAASSSLQGSGVHWAGILGLAAHVLLTALVLSIVLLALGATGTRQTTEGLLLVLILTLLLPVIADRLPVAATAALRVVLPPLEAVARLRDGIADGAWRAAGDAALRLGSWSAVLLVTSLALIGRRVPAQASRHRPPTA